MQNEVPGEDWNRQLLVCERVHGIVSCGAQGRIRRPGNRAANRQEDRADNPPTLNGNLQRRRRPVQNRDDAVSAEQSAGNT